MHLTSPVRRLVAALMALEKDLSLANRLVAALPAPQRAVFLEHCERVELKLHDTLIHTGDVLDYAYFPLDSFVAVVMPADDAPSAQVGMVGNEGMFPASLVLGVSTGAFDVRVQGAGHAFRIQRRALQSLLHADAWLQDVLNRYISVRQAQLAQQSVCLHSHAVEQRLARWLLMTRDRAHSSELFFTHEALASMLGVRRESVSRMARNFEKLGLISYSHGYIMLLDEAGLEKLSCRCYQANLRIYATTLGSAGDDDFSGYLRAYEQESTVTSLHKQDAPGKEPLDWASALMTA